MAILPVSARSKWGICPSHWRRTWLYATSTKSQKKIRRARKHMNANAWLVLIMLLVLLPGLIWSLVTWRKHRKILTPSPRLHHLFRSVKYNKLLCDRFLVSIQKGVKGLGESDDPTGCAGVPRKGAFLVCVESKDSCACDKRWPRLAGFGSTRRFFVAL